MMLFHLFTILKKITHIECDQLIYYPRLKQPTEFSIQLHIKRKEIVPNTMMKHELCTLICWVTLVDVSTSIHPSNSSPNISSMT